jgi:2'-5' RNA ligase
MTMRLFIATNFNSGTRLRLLALRDDLRSRSERGNFSLPENLHLTLAFLGKCGERQLSAAKAAMDAAAFPPFSADIGRLGRFRREGGDIWWAGIRESEALLGLQRELTERLITAGFSLERRKYSPHITLGREVVTDAVPWRIEPFGETVTAIELMKSERIVGKLTYTAIYEKRAEP